MEKEKIDASVDLMEEILDNMDKEPDHSQEDYKSLEKMYNEEVTKREKLESDYQNLFQKYKDRFTESVSSSKVESKVEPEEPEEEIVVDIHSIF